MVSSDRPDDEGRRAAPEVLLLVRAHPTGQSRAHLLAMTERWDPAIDGVGGLGGELFVLGDATDPAGTATAVALVATSLADGENHLEPGAALRWLVVDPARRSLGDDRRLFDGLCDILRARGLRCLRVPPAVGDRLGRDLLLATGSGPTGTELEL